MPRHGEVVFQFDLGAGGSGPLAIGHADNVAGGAWPTSLSRNPGSSYSEGPIPILFERDSSRSIPRNGAGAHSRFGRKAMIGSDHRVLVSGWRFAAWRSWSSE
jgi:hypothetical protein